MTRPCCAACGKPLAKFTRTLFFDGAGTQPKTREEVQRGTNLIVVSVKRWRDGLIHSAGAWDGARYGWRASNAFCTQSCAGDFGLASHRAGYRLPGKRP